MTLLKSILVDLCGLVMQGVPLIYERDPSRCVDVREISDGSGHILFG
jgi:hypothetical protein